jgi:hypothetical protein
LALYKTHLQAAYEWGRSWHIIQNSIVQTLNIEAEDRYKRLDEKLKKPKKLADAKDTHKIYTPDHTFYPRVANETNITFDEEEIKLLNKGLHYNIHYKHDKWLEQLACEAECAVSLLPQSEQQGTRYRIARSIRKIQTLQLANQNRFAAINRH